MFYELLKNAFVYPQVSGLSKSYLFSIHGTRSFVHFCLILTGLVYSFAQPLFLNSEVWTYVYCVGGAALFIDAFIFVFYRAWRGWALLYVLDAFFIGLVLYKTGYTFFPYLYFYWLMSIVFAGWQFDFKGAVLQGLWISCLFTWLVFLSPHFKSMETSLFFLHHLCLLATAALSGFSWPRIFMYFEQKRLFSSFWGEKTLNLENPSSEPVEGDIDEVFTELTKKWKGLKFINRQTRCDIFGSPQDFKKILFYLLEFFISPHSGKFILPMLMIEVSNDEKWLIVKMKGEYVKNKASFEFFNSMQDLSEIHRILKKNGGCLSADSSHVFLKWPLCQPPPIHLKKTGSL